MNSVFSFPKELPKHREEVPLYRVVKNRTKVKEMEERRQDFKVRAAHYQEVFRIKGKEKILKGSVVLQDKKNVLIIYTSSDSFWWYDEALANRETISEKAELPSDDEAPKIAVNYLRKIGMESKYAKFANVTRSITATEELGKLPTDITTEVHVNFSFTIDDYPIMGPGAKIRVSLVEGGQISSVVFFWRDPQKKEPPVTAIRPEDALTWLTRSQRFNKLTPDQIRITLTSMRFGYFAISPFSFQRFLIPVYEVRGTEESQFLGKRDVTYYRPAIDLSPIRIKRMSFLDRTDISRYLTSTK